MEWLNELRLIYTMKYSGWKSIYIKPAPPPKKNPIVSEKNNGTYYSSKIQASFKYVPSDWHTKDPSLW